MFYSTDHISEDKNFRHLLDAYNLKDMHYMVPQMANDLKKNYSIILSNLHVGSIYGGRGPII